MPILEIFTCVWQHQINQLSSASLYQTLSRSFKDPLQALNWALGNFNTDNSDRETTAGAHSDRGYSLGKTKKKIHTPSPMSCILCLKTNKKKTKKIKKEQKNKKAETNKKMQVIFLPDSEAPPCFPCNVKVSYAIHIYVFWLAGPAGQRKSLHVLVLVTNFYIANVG